MSMYYELEKNSCEVCAEKPARACVNEYKNKGKDFEKPKLHYCCLEHALDIYNKLENIKKKNWLLASL